MSDLGSIHWKTFEKFVLHVGCTYKRQKGSHRVYWRSDLIRPIVIPGKGTVSRTVIMSNLRTLQISTKEFLEILKEL